jgi:hypothetical protein
VALVVHRLRCWRHARGDGAAPLPARAARRQRSWCVAAAGEGLGGAENGVRWRVAAAERRSRQRRRCAQIRQTHNSAARASASAPSARTPLLLPGALPLPLAPLLRACLPASLLLRRCCAAWRQHQPPAAAAASNSTRISRPSGQRQQPLAKA